MPSPPADIFTFFKGRVALHAILQAAGIGAGDQVLLPGYTCVVVPNAVLYRGAEPVYLDIAADTYNIDLAAAEAGAGTRWDPRRARVLIVQHTYGIPCDMDAVADFARRHDLLVIEDACHTLGSTYRGRPVGGFGQAAFYSSQWSKPVTTGLGGWAVVNDPALRERVREVAAGYRAPRASEVWLLYLQHLVYGVVFRPSLFWIIQDLYRRLGDLGLVIGSSTGTELACEMPADYEKLMGAPQRRRLLHLLRRSAEMIAERRRHTAVIVEALQAAGLPTVRLPDAYDPVYLRYPLQVGNKDAVLARARHRRIQLGDWFLSPVHPNRQSWEAAGYRAGLCPVAETVSRRTVNIPTGGGIRHRDLERTVAFLAECAEPVAGAQASAS